MLNRYQILSYLRPFSLSCTSSTCDSVENILLGVNQDCLYNFYRRTGYAFAFQVLYLYKQHNPFLKMPPAHIYSVFFHPGGFLQWCIGEFHIFYFLCFSLHPLKSKLELLHGSKYSINKLYTKLKKIRQLAENKKNNGGSNRYLDQIFKFFTIYSPCCEKPLRSRLKFVAVC